MNVHVFPIRFKVKLDFPLVAILDRERNHILMGQDKMLWEQNDIFREQYDMLCEQNDILREQDKMLWEQNIFPVGTQYLSCGNKNNKLWDQDIILREHNNIFYPAISTFAVQICYTNKFLLYSY